MLTTLRGYGESRQTVVINIYTLLDKVGIKHEALHEIWPLLPAQLTTMFEHNSNSDNSLSGQGLTHITAYCETENIELKKMLNLLLEYYGIKITDNNRADLILQCAEKDDKKNNATSIICDLSPFVGSLNKQTVVNWVEVRQHLILTLYPFTIQTTKESQND